MPSHVPFRVPAHIRRNIPVHIPSHNPWPIPLRTPAFVSARIASRRSDRASPARAFADPVHAVRARRAHFDYAMRRGSGACRPIAEARV